jgi:hypothetical protein
MPFGVCPFFLGKLKRRIMYLDERTEDYWYRKELEENHNNTKAELLSGIITSQAVRIGELKDEIELLQSSWYSRLWNWLSN